MFSTTRAAPLDLNVAGSFQPLVHPDPSVISSGQMSHATAHLQHVDSQIGGYLVLHRTNASGSSLDVVFALEGTVDASGSINWKLSGGRCSGGSASWCSKLGGSSGGQTQFPFRADGYFDGDRLVLGPPRATSGRGLNPPIGGLVMVHDGFRPMMPGRPVIDGPIQDADHRSQGRVVMRIDAGQGVTTRRCTITLSVRRQGGTTTWNGVDLTCNGSSTGLTVESRSFTFDAQGRLEFVIRKSQSNSGVTRRLFVGTVGQLGTSSQWRITGRVADDSQQTYTGQGGGIVTPSDIAPADRIGVFTVSLSYP